MEQQPRRLAMIVAASENDVIGRDGDMPWRLSADLKRFKKLTMGHHIIMGRKTLDSIGLCLPGRQTVVMTRQAGFRFSDATVAHSVDEAIDLAMAAGDELPFIVGGGEVYRLALPLVTEIHLTRVHAEIDGDTFLPKIVWSDWQQIESHSFSADSKNSADYSFQLWRRP